LIGGPLHQADQNKNDENNIVSFRNDRGIADQAGLALVA